MKKEGNERRNKKRKKEMRKKSGIEDVVGIKEGMSRLKQLCCNVMK